MSSFWDRLRGKVDQDALSEAPKGLVVRMVANIKPGEHRVERYNEATGEKYLADDVTGEPKPWPLLGVLAEVAPQSVIIPSDYPLKHDWITLEGHRIVHRSGGPPENPWAVTHTFQQADAIVLHTLEGDIRYRVVHQPDKYEDSTEPGKMRVDWFFLAEKETSNG